MKINLFLTNILLLLSLIVTSQNIEITHGPYLQAMNEEGVTIMWTTNKKSISWVEIAPEGSDSFYAQVRSPFYDTSHGSRVVDTLHRVRVEGLQPGTTYRYRIFSKEMLGYNRRILYGDVISTYEHSHPYRFTTLNKSEPDITFKVVNDIHTRTSMLNDMLRDIKQENTDFVIFNGDMVDAIRNEKDIFNGFMDSAVKLFGPYIPIFYARGNHETRGPFSVHFPEYFPTINNKLYYNFTHGPVHFVILDGGEDKPDSDIEYSELAQFDAYRSKQQKWLQKIVESPEYKEALYRVVVIHIPPLGSTWHGTLDVQRKFLPILNNANVDIMLSGHFHRYEYIEPNKVVSFPILVNSNETYLDVKADQKEMNLLVKDPKGSELHKITIKK